MNIKQITPHVCYAGVNDRTTQLFEALWPLPDGISYNSYIVTGNDKTALIDGTEISQSFRLIENITSITGGRHPDYIIINHMEPDHSGALRIIRSIYPEITIVGNIKTLEMVKGFYGIEGNMITVKDGDTIDLGGITLNFKLTPMLHWPETMMTYIPEEKVLFSGDAFGCFGALSGGITDDETDIEPFIPEIYRYYANIIGKYGTFVQKALDRLKGLNIQYICSTHGPVWHNKIQRILVIHNRLSRYEGDKGVVIVYGSMYGNTEDMVEAVATRFAEQGIKNIRIHNAAHVHPSFILRDIFRYRGLVIAAPTYSNTIFPPIKNILNAIENREIKNHIIGIMGSFSWGAQATKQISLSLEALKQQHTGEAIESRYAPTADIITRCRKLADEIASRL